MPIILATFILNHNPKVIVIICKSNSMGVVSPKFSPYDSHHKKSILEASSPNNPPNTSPANKKTNNITTTKELYESLRYPEDNSLTIKEYDYFDLKYNGDFGIGNFKVLLKRICEVKEVILKEYHEKY